MKLRLDNSEMVECFFDETRLIGIVAPFRDYQFCWLVNQKLQFDFRTYQDLEIQLEKKKRKYYFTIYNHTEQLGHSQHYLYQNSYDGEYLLPEFKNLDYLWLIKGEIKSDDSFEQLMTSIRTIDGVQLVTEISDEKIKNKTHLVL
jgi:hypothetical protein